MSGNVWEWCSDWYGSYDTVAIQTNPIGPAIGSERIVRGGGWLYSSSDVRSARREVVSPNTPSTNVGFRIVKDAK